MRKLSKENIEIKDITYENSGTLTTVYKFKDKVIKIGDPRLYDFLPNNKYILKPLYRETFRFDNHNIYVEVSDYINHNNKVIFEDVYFVYQKLRDKGIIWLDCKNDNLGKKYDESLVVIDLDLFFKEKVLNLNDWKDRIDISNYEICERRYQYEQRQIKKYLKNL